VFQRATQCCLKYCGDNSTACERRHFNSRDESYTTRALSRGIFQPPAPVLAFYLPACLSSFMSNSVFTNYAHLDWNPWLLCC
jgi:hypothetical protein